MQYWSDDRLISLSTIQQSHFVGDIQRDRRNDLKEISVLSCINHSSHDMEMSSDRRMDKENVVYSYNGIVSERKKTILLFTTT